MNEVVMLLVYMSRMGMVLLCIGKVNQSEKTMNLKPDSEERRG